jgi:hypothetical protein
MVVLVGSMYRVRSVISGAVGLPGLATHYYRSTTVGGVLADAQAVANRVRAGWSAGTGIFQNVITVQVQPQVDVLDDTTGKITGGQTVTAPAVVTGTGVGGFGPTPAAGLIRWETNTIVRGRRLRGRTFLSPLGANMFSGSVMAPGFLTAAAAIAVGMEGTLPANPPMVVWSRPTAAAVGTSADVTGHTIPTLIAVLRSRRD